MTQLEILKACFMTYHGVCTQMDAMVPTTTMVNAALDSKALIPAPLSTAPTSKEAKAKISPKILRKSNCRFGFAIVD